MMLREYYVREHGSDKGYIFLKMQAAIVLSLAVSVAYSFLNYAALLALQLVPLALLLAALSELHREYPRDLPQYAALFGLLFAGCALAPVAFKYLFSFSSVFASIRYLIYIFVGLIVLYLFFEAAGSRRQMTGKVLLADRDLAVVQVDYDLIGRVAGGKYAVANRGARKGQRVRIAVRKRIFGAAVPDRILGVAR
jgi:uncharacterized membrane protein